MGLPTLLAELVGMTSGTIAIDVETVSLKDRTPIGIGIANAPNNAFYFPIPSTIIPWALLKNPNITKVLHNGHFDLMVIKAHFGVDVENFVDTIVAARLLGYPPALGKLAKDFFDIDIPSINSLIGKKGKSQLTMDQIPIDKVANKCAMDCQNTLALWDQFKNAVPPKAFDLEMKVMPVIMDIQRRGIRIDKVKLQTHIDRITKEVNWYRTIAKGYGFNPGSSKQIAAILQGRGWQIMYDRKTKNPKMDKDTLDRYYGEDPLARLAIIYKGQASLLNNTLRPILDKHLVGDRIHPNINQNVAETGRFSTSNPNVNNITEILRDIVIPADGMMFEDWDLSQIELRDIAYLSQDPEMLKVFADPNGDIHSETSNFVFGDHSPYHRQLAKAINFAIIYGGDAYTLYINNNVPYHIGEQYLYTYFQRFSRLKEWIEQTKAFAHANGYTETILGRRRSHQDINAPEIWKRAKAERELINHPVQGSAAEHLKELTWRLRDQLQDNLIHDESLMERYPHKVPDDGVVDNLAPFKTPADVKVGDNWKDVKKIMTIGI